MCYFGTTAGLTLNAIVDRCWPERKFRNAYYNPFYLAHCCHFPCKVFLKLLVLEWRLVYVGTAKLQHPLFWRYISFLGQFIVLVWYLVSHGQEVLTLTVSPLCTKCFAQSWIKHLCLYGKHENLAVAVSLYKSVGRVVVCQSRTSNLKLWICSCGTGFRSAGLASAVTNDRQQDHCVYPSAGERKRT